VKDFNRPAWQSKLDAWKKLKPTLIQQYAREREVNQVPIKVSDKTFQLSPGDHNILIKSIVDEFAPRFAPGSKVIYLGDTSSKSDHFDHKEFKELGLTLNVKGKLPDVVLKLDSKRWVFLIESVTSHGPVDGKRRIELEEVFQSCKYGIVYVSAFQNKKVMSQYFNKIAWETEVWVADNPTHMIHLNGDKFLGPY
jgi:adenine-specific DNA-methyltransferase